MRLIITLLLTLTWKIHKVENEVCGKPEVARQLWHIYRINEPIDVTVHHCYYTHTLHKYSDVTEHCVQAYNTNIYTDKWDDNYPLSQSSPIRIKSYNAKVNIIENEIILKSGTKCRYDRGFCYDPRESFDYAAVWNVIKKGLDLENKNLEQIFYGWLDMWTLKRGSLHYLVFQDSRTDRSFAVQLVKSDQVRGKDFWYTEQYGIIASQQSLKENIKSTPLLNQKYLPLLPKQRTAEHVLRSCDLESFPLDFNIVINESHLSDLDNLKVILASLQKQITQTKPNFTSLSKPSLDNQISKDISQMKNDIKNVQALLFIKDKEVSELQTNIKNIQNTLLNNDIGRLEDKVRTILNQQENRNTVIIANLNISLATIKNKLSYLENKNSKVTDVTNLEKSLSELQIKLQGNDDNIFVTLKNTDKEIKEIAKNLSNIYSQLKIKDEQLTKEEESLREQLNNLDLEFNKRIKDIAKFQNESKIFVAEKERYSVELSNQFRQTLNEVSAKLNLHDDQISKCKNYIDSSIYSKSKLLETAQNDIGNLKSILSENKQTLKDISHNYINITKYCSDIDSKIERLNSIYTPQQEQIIIKLSKNENEMKEIKEKTILCQKEIKETVHYENRAFEVVQNNISEFLTMIVNGEKQVSSLQDNFRDCSFKLSLIEKNCSEEVNNLRQYTNVNLNDKDVKLTELKNTLTEKDKEVKALYNSIQQLQDKNEYLVAKVNKYEEEIDVKLKEKDKTIKRIEDNHKKREDYFRREIEKRDKLYETLIQEISTIKQYMGLVEPV